jgi:glutamate 5-kinase
MALSFLEGLSMERLELTSKAMRIVVKVGTSTLTHPNGRLHFQRMDALARQLTDLRNSGREVVLVSSGAVGAGLGRLGISGKPKTMPERQAAAAIGQGLLMQIYTKIFGEYNQVVAQVLLTREDLDHRLRYLNARNTLNTLLGYGVIPIVNENDTVATDELDYLHFGDNDKLSALVASAICADLLILLSDIDGLYDRDPRRYSNASRLELVESITPEIAAGAGGAGTARGTGGMTSKLEAAKIITHSGSTMILADGSVTNIIDRIIQGETVGTLFMPRESSLLERKRWIAFAGCPAGTLKIDEGAAIALLERGKSLLPSGIVNVIGEFSPGDLVRVVDGYDREIARGLSNYGASDLCRIIGRKSSEITKILGHKSYDEVIHRNNMVCL